MSCRVCGNYRYKVTKDGNARIFLYEGRGNIKLDIGCTLVIPEKLNGYRVTSIAGNAFYGLDFLVNVTLPKSIVFVENSAFRNCDNLRKVENLEYARYVGKNAFKGCRRLQEVVFPPNFPYTLDQAVQYVYFRHIETGAFCEKILWYDSDDHWHGPHWYPEEYVKYEKHKRVLIADMNQFSFCPYRGCIDFIGVLKRPKDRSGYGPELDVLR